MSVFELGKRMLSPVSYFYRYRELTLEMARRELLDRYAGQVFGPVWAVAHPLFMVAVFVFLYRNVLAIRIDEGVDGGVPLGYTGYLLSGMIPWLAFQDALSKSCPILRANSSLVKQVIFPIEILPVKTVLVSFSSQIIGTVCLIVWVISTTGTLPATYGLLPLLWLVQIIAMCGLAFILAALGSYFADIKELVQAFGSVGIYLMPIVYLPEWVPATYRPFLQLNPFSHMAWCYQDACYYGRIEHPVSWVVFSVGSLVTFAVGWWSFQKLKIFFGSVL